MQLKNASKDAPKNAPKHAPTDAPKDALKDAPKDAPNDDSKDFYELVVTDKSIDGSLAHSRGCQSMPQATIAL